MPITDREYHEHDTSAGDAELIRARVREIRPNILLYRELERPTVYSVRLLAEGVERLRRAGGRFALVVDLSKAGLPSATVRQALRETLLSHEGLVFVSAFTDRNIAIKVAAGLVLSQATSVKYAVSRTEGEALRRAFEALEPTAGR